MYICLYTYICFPETLRATGGLEIPFSFLALCSVTLPASAHPRPLPFPLRRHRHMLVARAPQPTVCVQASGCVSGFSFVDSSHMLGAFEPVLIGPRGKHHKPNIANIYLLHTAGCGTRACMERWRRRLQLSWRLMESVPTGSVQLPAEAER